MSSIETLLTSYLASSTPGEANDRYYAIMGHIERYGRTSNALDDRLEDAEKQVNRKFDVRVISDISLNDDFGTETRVQMLYCETLIGLRHRIRDMNPGRIDIYSDYDCTGLVCGMSAKFIKIYRIGSGHTALVEVSITRDV